MFERRAMPQKATCSTHTRTEEEDVAVQEETDEVRPMKNNSQLRQEIGNNRGTFEIRGRFHTGPSRQAVESIECEYCGKIDHHEEEC